MRLHGGQSIAPEDIILVFILNYAFHAKEMVYSESRPSKYIFLLACRARCRVR